MNSTRTLSLSSALRHTVRKCGTHLNSIIHPENFSVIADGVVKGVFSSRDRFYSSWMRTTFTPVTWMSNGDGYNNGGGNGRTKGKGRGLGETTILLQEGLDIQEVPVAVLRSDPGTDENGNGKADPRKSYVTLDPDEEAAYVDGFKSYHTPQEVLKILDTIPSQEVTPFVSLSILRKLFELENNFGFRNEGKPWVISTEHVQVETFARTAIVSRLIETIISAEDPSILIQALDILRSERLNHHFQSTSWGNSNGDELGNYRNKLFEEILIRVTEGKLSLEQVCHAVVCLGKMETERGFKFSSDLIDKLWVGILEKNADISINNIVDVCRTVPYFNKSRRLVMSQVERKVMTLLWRMDSKIVSEICSILLMGCGTSSQTSSKVNTLGVSNRMLLILSKCTNVNIHQVKEEELIKIVQAFHVLNFFHPSIEKALSKYMKAKCLKISNPQLVAVVMDYAKKFRIRSPHILEGGAEYMILHNGSTLSAPQFASVLSPFGHLDYQPPNGYKFWEIAEKLLDEKFIQFPPKEIVDLLLSCVYISKFPLNFIDRIFSPYFLDRLHTIESDYTVLQYVRSRLKLLDTALTMECEYGYRGPMLPRDFTARKVFIDGRIGRMTSLLEMHLQNIYEDHINVESSVVLPNLPLNEFYILDLVLSPKGSVLANLLKNRINFRGEGGRANTERRSPTNDEDNLPKDLIAVLINIPEHFSSDGKYLIGPQAMRSRHLKTLGFSVANLKYETLAELRTQPNSLNDYLKEHLTQCGLPGV